MSNHWLVYWNWDTVTYELDTPPALLTHAASAQFGKVQAGDTLWVVSIPSKSSGLPRDLMLVGRMPVALCTSDLYEALHFLGLNDPEALWEAAWHACAVREEIEPLRLINVQDEAADLRFQSQQDRLTPIDGQVNPQQLQTMRLLTAESAERLDLHWSLTREFERQVDAGEIDLSDMLADGDLSGQQLDHSDKFTGPLMVEYNEGEHLRALLKKTVADDDLQYPEGRQVLVEHLKRERNRTLVKAAKTAFSEEHGRLFCEVCDFDFGEVYGDLGFGYIEAHHTLPVSQLQADATNRIGDLAMVCANCHRMLHASDPLLSVSELCRLLKQVRADSD